jgi:uncharacterized protein
MAQRRKPLDSVLIKPAGPDCNLACRYCFYLDRARLFPDSSAHRMAPAVLEATVRQVMGRGPRQVSFGWQGGEPTLMGVEFFRHAVELQTRYGDGRIVGNGLQTNGLLVDDEWCRFLRDARFLVGLSLDGPEHIHDHYRLGRSGRPTWRHVDEALRRMLDHDVDVNSLVVLTDYSVRFAREIYEFLKARGLTFMQFIPCVDPYPDDPDRLAPFAVSPEPLGAFLCELFDAWLGDFRDGEPTTSVRWFDSIFATYVGLSPPECSLLDECGTYVVVEHNGDVYACDFFVEPDWKLGNVLTGSLADMLHSPLQTRFGRRKSHLPHECRACPWLPHCRGGCPRERGGGPRHSGRSRLCEGYRMFFAHADARMKALADAWLRQRGLDGALPPAPSRR